MVGITEASAIRNPEIPRTRKSLSTTAMLSCPMRAVPTGWKIAVPTCPAASTSSAWVSSCASTRGQSSDFRQQRYGPVRQTGTSAQSVERPTNPPRKCTLPGFQGADCRPKPSCPDIYAGAIRSCPVTGVEHGTRCWPWPRAWRSAENTQLAWGHRHRAGATQQIFQPDPTLTNAILGRLVHIAHRMTLTSDSMRRKMTTMKMLDQGFAP